MRIFIGESDRGAEGPHKGKPLYEALLHLFRENGFAGATVIRGIAAFGASARAHTDRILRLSMDLPIVVEVVDGDERIEAVMPELGRMIGGGLITLERARRPRRDPSPPRAPPRHRGRRRGRRRHARRRSHPRLDPDVVFLDIEMPEMDGFDVIDAIGVEAMPRVILITAYDEFALSAPSRPTPSTTSSSPSSPSASPAPSTAPGPAQ